MHCTWIYNNEFFIIKWSHIMHITNFVSKIDKKIYLEGSISPIKKPKVVILQNQNLRKSVCNWAKPQGVIMQFGHIQVICSLLPIGNVSFLPSINKSFGSWTCQKINSHQSLFKNIYSLDIWDYDFDWNFI